MAREWILLADGWRFLRDEAPEAWRPSFDDRSWETVGVPHCFNAADTFLPKRGYYRGPGWYRLVLPELPASRRVELEALGSFALTHVWLNGALLGRFMGGFTGFSVDLTPHLRSGRNVLALRVSNQHNPDVLPGKEIPDYNLYGGIYREIGLTITDPLHIVGRGLIASTPAVSEEAACVHLNVRVRNDRRGKAAGRVTAEIVSPDGHIVARGERPYAIAAKGERLVHVPLPPVERPALWSPDDPKRYTVRVGLHDDGGLVDEGAREIGFRWYRFDADKGFFLNGKPLKLRGVNRHQDYPGLGNAIPANLQALDVELIKELGGNFVRCSHYPMHPAFLDACDRLGVLVYEEIASWQYIGGEAFARNAEQMMEEMIARDRHHPSIILWGLLNEGRDVALFRRLNDTAHRMDPWRLTIYAENNPEEGAKLGTTVVPDVLGLNYKVPHLDELRVGELAGMRVMSSEHTNANIGERRREPGQVPEWVDDEVWQMRRVMQDVVEFEKQGWIAGSTLWCMHDYGTDYGPVWPHHYSGVIDAWRLPKVAALAMRAHWATKPVVHIAGHWTWPGDEGKERPVVVVSNADEVELVLDGRSLGRRSRADGFTWQVPYQPGTLAAIGRFPGGVEVRDERRTAGEPAALRIEALHGELAANGTDVTLVTVTIVDAQGIRVPTANVHVHVEADGDAAFFGLGGRPEVVTHAGWGRIALRAGRTPGDVRVSASAAGLATVHTTVRMRR